MTTGTLPRTTLAEQAVSARNGADLFRFGLSDRIPDRAFAKNPDGSYTVTGIDFLKTGTFNGLSLVDGDLEAMVSRFVDLRDSGIFLPPFRLDHSWSILSVVGWIEDLETYRRVDSTDATEKTFLRGSVRLTGSVDYKPADLVDAIKRGALTNRSSELGYYVTNAGVELPLVFYGCAFVDIPAVEGLAPVELARTRLSVPHTVTTLSTPEGSPRMDPDQIARLVELRAMTSLSEEDQGERDRLEQLAADTETEIPDAADSEETGVETAPSDATDAAADDEETPNVRDAGDTDEADLDGGDGTEDPDAGDGDPDPDAGSPAGGTEDAPTGAPADQLDELSRLRNENARLRREAAEREVARFRSAGLVTQANEEAATALLTHHDENVRRSAGTLLGSIPARVETGRRPGRTSLSSSSTGGNVGAGDQVIRLGMEPDEVGAIWSALSTEERKLRQPEYDAWRADRAGK